MTDRALDAVHRQARCRFAEHGANGGHLHGIVVRGAGTVGADHIDGGRRQLRIGEGCTHGPRRPGRYGLTIDFEDRPDSPDLGRLAESTVWVNTAHPAYLRAVASRAEGYHVALSVGLALAAVAVEPHRGQEFLTAFLARWGEALGRDTGCTFAYTSLHHSRPAICDARVKDSIDAAARGLGLSTRQLPSGAGHDAQHMARLGPTGMIFVPSVGGISHAPKEFTKPEDVVNGANVLLQTGLALDTATWT